MRLHPFSCFYYVHKMKRISGIFIAITTALFVFCTNIQAQEEGIASYYGNKFHGRRTSSGEIYDKDGYSCAHRTLPFGTWLKVTCLKNGKSTMVKVIDRGPFGHGRIIDLSYAAARDIGIIRSGIAKVKVNVVNMIDDAYHQLNIPHPFKENELVVRLSIIHNIDSIKYAPIQWGKKKRKNSR